MRQGVVTMSMSVNVTAMRLSREVPSAELAIDAALLATTNVLQTMLSARSEGVVPAHAGQLALAKVIQSQKALMEASNDFLRVHQELAALGREMMVADYGECPPAKGSVQPDVVRAA